MEIDPLDREGFVQHWDFVVGHYLGRESLLL